METNVMRCRHCGAAWDLEYEYCPQCDRNYSGAVYPAQHTAQEIEDAARVAKEIRDAFHPFPWVADSACHRRILKECTATRVS